jgi:hypothetical protein
MTEENEIILINQIFNSVLSGGATFPTFIQESETAWNNATSPKSTTFDVQTGDVLVAFSVLENGSSGGEITISSSPVLTWTQQEEYGQGAASTTYVSVWTAVAGSNTSVEVSFSCNNGFNFGGNVLTFRGSSGIGAAEQNNNAEGSGAPTVDITTTQANSIIVMANGDWNALDGSSGTYDESEAGAFTELTQDNSGAGSTYVMYGGYYSVGAVGTYTIGITSPNTQRYGIVAVEVKGT